jgi:transposase-like protein
VLLTFYDFPAEHWKHIRTTNPIESVFATVRNRTRKTKGCLSRKAALSMVFKLMMSAKKSGESSVAQIVCPKSFKKLSSRTGSSNFKTPPNQTVTNFCA